MKIIIAGAGNVGTHLAKLLSREKQDIILMDDDEEKLSALSANFDLLTVAASPSSISGLKEVGVKEADLFIAVTPDESRNMTACMLATNLGAKKTVARIDNYEYLLPKNKEFFQKLGVDSLIYPEMLAAKEIVSSMRMSWVERCQEWKAKYPVVQKKHYEDTKHTNVYAFIKELSSRLSEGQVTVVGNGSACVVGSHAYVIKKGQRFIINSAIASMGYDLPAAIGAVVAEHGNLALNREALKHDDIKDVILVTGDGSIQMNIQELQTIIHHQMPIKIFVINNQGYHSIRQTQTNLFEKHFVGIGPESGDLSFPDMGKLAPAYGYPFFRCETNAQLDETISKVLAVKGPAICEIMVSTEQKFEPKSATKRLEDGTLVSPPLEDLAPFLDRDEFYSNMIIKPIS